MKTPETITAAGEVVSFDLWDTLIHTDGQAFSSARSAMLGSVLAPHLDPAMFGKVAEEEDRRADRFAESRSEDVLFEERIAMLAKAVDASMPTQNTLDALYIEQSTLFEAHAPALIDTKTPALLEELATSRRLAVISNTGYMRGTEMRRVLGKIGILDMFSHLIFSNEVGYAKPSRRIYEALIREARTSPERITHIGRDLYADIEGAQEVGIRAIHLAPGQMLSDLVRLA